MFGPSYRSAAGRHHGVAIEFLVHPIQETGKRPAAVCRILTIHKKATQKMHDINQNQIP
jgi:hypothetical protein